MCDGALSQEQRAATRENVERRMARTADELQEEEEEAEAEAEESDEEETVPYNPKNLPLGWDGKVSRNITFPFSNQDLIQSEGGTLGSPPPPPTRI